MKLRVYHFSARVNGMDPVMMVEEFEGFKVNANVVEHGVLQVEVLNNGGIIERGMVYAPGVWTRAEVVEGMSAEEQTRYEALVQEAEKKERAEFARRGFR